MPGGWTFDGFHCSFGSRGRRIYSVRTIGRSTVAWRTVSSYITRCDKQTVEWRLSSECNAQQRIELELRPLSNASTRTGRNSLKIAPFERTGVWTVQKLHKGAINVNVQETRAFQDSCLEGLRAVEAFVDNSTRCIQQHRRAALELNEYFFRGIFTFLLTCRMFNDVLYMPVYE